MGEATKISWSRSTYSPHIGCTEVSPACDFCYARELDKHYKYGGATHWGAGVPRYRTKTWKQVMRWNAVAEIEKDTGKIAVQGSDWHTPGFWPVFPSMCDPFDNEVDAAWHAEFWRLIRATPHLTWLLLTKRVGNVKKFAPAGAHPNVRIGASICNQEEADRDVPKLLAVSGFAKRFMSLEPLLGPIDFYKVSDSMPSSGHPWLNGPILQGIDQIIIGAESGPKRRPMEMEWARSTIEQCKAAGVACFVKQDGAMRDGQQGRFTDAEFAIKEFPL